MPPKAKTKVVITKTKPKSPGTTTIATQVMIHNETINSIPASMLVDKQKDKPILEKNFNDFLNKKQILDKGRQIEENFNKHFFLNNLTKPKQTQRLNNNYEQFNQLLGEVVGIDNHFDPMQLGLDIMPQVSQNPSSRTLKQLQDNQLIPQPSKQQKRKNKQNKQQVEQQIDLAQMAQNGQLENGFIKLKINSKNRNPQKQNKMFWNQQSQNEFYHLFDDTADITATETKYREKIMQLRKKRLQQQCKFIPPMQHNLGHSEQAPLHPELSFALQAFYSSQQNPNNEYQEPQQLEQNQSQLQNQIIADLNQNADFEQIKQAVHDQLFVELQKQYGDALIDGKFKFMELLEQLSQAKELSASECDQIYFSQSAENDHQCSQEAQNDQNQPVNSNLPEFLVNIQEKLSFYQKELSDIKYRHAVAHKPDADKVQLTLEEQSVLQESIIELGRELNQAVDQANQVVSRKSALMSVLSAFETKLTQNAQKAEGDLMKAGEALVAIDKKVNQMRRSALKARESALSDNVADYKRWEQLTIAEWNSRVKRE